jgi:hypothetical protein
MRAVFRLRIPSPASSSWIHSGEQDITECVITEQGALQEQWYGLQSRWIAGRAARSGVRGVSFRPPLHDRPFRDDPALAWPFQRLALPGRPARPSASRRLPVRPGTSTVALESTRSAPGRGDRQGSSGADAGTCRATHMDPVTPFWRRSSGRPRSPADCYALGHIGSRHGTYCHAQETRIACRA